MLVGVLVWAMVATSGAAAQAPRACTAADLSGTTTPVELEQDFADHSTASTLAVGRPYAAVVLPEEAISRDSGRNTGLRDGSARVTGPSGLLVAERDDADRGRHVFAFTPTAPGMLHLDFAWIVDIDKGRPTADACAASAAVNLPVHAPRPITTKATFTGSSGPGGSGLAGYRLRLVLPPPDGLPEAQARAPGPVTMLVRLRRGTTRPPGRTAKVAYKVTYRYDQRAEFLTTGGQGPDYVARYFSNISWDSSGLEIGCNPNAPRRGLRFAVSVEVRQGGKLVGGMRAGGICKSERFRRKDGVTMVTRTRARMVRRSFAASP